MSVNRIVLVGRVGAPAELRYRTNGVAVTLFRLATDRSAARGQSESIVATDWHSVEVEGGLGLARNDSAKRAAMLLQTGTEAYVEGSLWYRQAKPGVSGRPEAVVMASRIEILSQPEQPGRSGVEGAPVAPAAAGGPVRASRSSRRHRG